MNVVIHHGDCLDIMRTMPDACVDAVVTDPPYSSGGQFRGDRMATTRIKYCQTQSQHDLPNFSGDNRDQRGYLAWSTLWMSQARRLTVSGGLVAVFSDWRQLPITTDAIQAAGWVWRGIAVWVKKSARPIKGRWNQQAEFIVWGTNGPRATEGKCGTSAWMAATPSGSKRVHMTQKPDDLMEGLLAVFERGQTILDPFCGSGATGRAAMRNGLNFIGIEMSDDYAAQSRERILEVTPTLPALPAVVRHE